MKAKTSPKAIHITMKNREEYGLPTHHQKDNAAKMNDKLTGKINNETPIRGIKHWGLSAYSNILPRIKFGVTESRVPRTISYEIKHQPLPYIINHTIITKRKIILLNHITLI